MGHICFILDLHASKSRVLSTKSMTQKSTVIVSEEFYVKQINDKILQHLKRNVDRKHRVLF